MRHLDKPLIGNLAKNIFSEENSIIQDWQSLSFRFRENYKPFEKYFAPLQNVVCFPQKREVRKGKTKVFLPPRCF